jgi:hypothetical protein
MRACYRIFETVFEGGEHCKALIFLVFIKEFNIYNQQVAETVSDMFTKSSDPAVAVRAERTFPTGGEIPPVAGAIRR